MITLQNHLGHIDISKNFFINLIGQTVTQSFGVAGMATAGATQGVRNYLKSIKIPFIKDVPSKGVAVRYSRQRMTVDLHIIVSYGTNVSAIVASLTEKVKYIVEEASGLTVSRVNVYVDGMKNE